MVDYTVDYIHVTIHIWPGWAESVKATSITTGNDFIITPPVGNERPQPRFSCFDKLR